MSILNKSDDLLVSVIKVLLSYQLFIEHEGKGGSLNNKSFSKCINKKRLKRAAFLKAKFYATDSGAVRHKLSKS